jgi:hypothetical protein
MENHAGCTPAIVGKALSVEENRANCCKDVDGKPQFSALYGMYTITMTELKAILKMCAQAGQSGVVNRTSVEIKGRNRNISNNTSQTAKKSTKQVPTSAAV